MSGIALIIPGADFSGSSLGQVTFSSSIKERAAEAVDAYASVLGSHTYDDELNKLVLSLMNIGVWDKISVFPMLGDTVAKKVLSLNQSNDDTVKTLYYPNTVTVSNGELLFTNGQTSPTFAGTSKNISNIKGLKSAFRFIDFVRTSPISVNGSSATSNDLALGTTTAAGGVSARLSIYIPTSVGSVGALAVSGAERHTLACHIDDTKARVYLDAVQASETAINDVSTEYSLTNILGAKNNVGANQTDLFDGTIRLFAFGLIDTNKKAVDTINAIQQFLNTVKPNV